MHEKKAAAILSSIYAAISHGSGNGDYDFALAAIMWNRPERQTLLLARAKALEEAAQVTDRWQPEYEGRDDRVVLDGMVLAEDVIERRDLTVGAIDYALRMLNAMDVGRNPLGPALRGNALLGDQE